MPSTRPTTDKLTTPFLPYSGGPPIPAVPVEGARTVICGFLDGTSQILRCSKSAGDLLHLLCGHAGDPRVESTTQDRLDGHDVGEAMRSDPRRQKRLGITLDQMHAQDRDTITVVHEVRAHDQTQHSLTWTLEHRSVPPDFSTTHQGRLSEAPAASTSRVAVPLTGRASTLDSQRQR